MVQFKKIVAGLLSAVVMIASVGASADAAIVDRERVLSPGGSGGQMYAILNVEKDYLTPQNNGYYAYKYGVTAYYEYGAATATRWDITAQFNKRTTSKVVTAYSTNQNKCYAYSTLTATDTQYISGNHTAVATSTAYGNTTINLNVVY